MFFAGEQIQRTLLCRQISEHRDLLKGKTMEYMTTYKDTFKENRPKSCPVSCCVNRKEAASSAAVSAAMRIPSTATQVEQETVES